MNASEIERFTRAILKEEPTLGRDAIARRLGITPNGTLRRIVERLKAGQPIVRAKQSSAADTPPPSESRDFKANSAEISTCRPNVRTLDELLAYMRVDLKVWEVERHTINKWETVMREPATTIGGAGDAAVISHGKHGEKSTLWTRGSKEPLHEPLFQVKAWLRRKQPAATETALEHLITRIPAVARPCAPHRPPPRNQNRYLLEVSLYDAHFGLLAWGKETGEAYDLKIAETRYLDAMADLLAKTAGWKPERILLPIGNDFFHVNNPEGVTPTAHNVLDVDGRLPKVLEAGQVALIRAIDHCLRIAPVQVLWIPGNHDPQTSYFLCRVLQAWFRANPNVTVDVAPSPRKYVRYGINLLGFTHGNEENHADLPTIMAGECRADWSQVRHCEWHVGHYHKRRETRYSAGDTYGAVAVKVIPSICGTDAWHFRKGYVQGERVADAFVYDFHHGLTGTFTSRDQRGK